VSPLLGFAWRVLMSEPTQTSADLHDLTVAVEGLGCEVEALNMTLRELLSVVELGQRAHDRMGRPRGDTVSPLRTSEGLAEEMEHLRAEQDGGRAAAYIVLAALVGSASTILFVLYLVGS
jgi:hypothetical protein